MINEQAKVPSGPRSWNFDASVIPTSELEFVGYVISNGRIPSASDRVDRWEEYEAEDQHKVVRLFELACLFVHGLLKPYPFPMELADGSFTTCSGYETGWMPEGFEVTELFEWAEDGNANLLAVLVENYLPLLFPLVMNYRFDREEGSPLVAPRDPDSVYDRCAVWSKAVSSRPTWNFDITRITPEDLKVLMFFLMHKRMPAVGDLDPAPVCMEAFIGSREFTLIELAALFANGVLNDPGPVLRDLHWSFLPEGGLPESWNDDRVYDLAQRGGGNLLKVFELNGLERIVPILAKYRFDQ